MKGKPIRRALVLVSIVATFAGVPGMASAQQAGGSPTALSVRAVESTLVAGEPVTFEWTYTDPDAFTAFRGGSIDHGDRSRTDLEPGLAFPPCGELRYAQGATETFDTFHVYEAPGTYEVTATVTTRQQLCGHPLADEETAEVTITVVVRPAA